MSTGAKLLAAANAGKSPDRAVLEQRAREALDRDFMRGRPVFGACGTSREIDLMTEFAAGRLR